jgi:von Willebrand factor type A domain
MLVGACTTAVLACASDSAGGFASGTPTLAESSGGMKAGTDPSSGGPSSLGSPESQSPPSPNDFDKCASATVSGMPAPVHIVIAQDTSGSMCELTADVTAAKDCTVPGSKWQQTIAALNGFFTSQASRDSFASIIPWTTNLAMFCANYTALTPKDVALPDTNGTLTAALKKIKPDGGTPTANAIKAAHAYATQLKAGLTDGGHVVIALATDGLPTPECGGFTETGALKLAEDAAAAASAAGLPVFVIGVGDAVGNLDGIAAAAKTNGNKAFLVTTDVATELNTALQKIKDQALGCELQMPKPPNGQTLDPKKVNLTFTPPKGAVQTLAYSQDCASSSGWQYFPNAARPTSVRLCGTACAAARASGQGAISIVLGCEVNVTIK